MNSVDVDKMDPPVDGWALGQEAVRAAAAPRPEGDAETAQVERRLADAVASFGRNPRSVAAILDEINRRATIDVNAPTESAHAAVARLKVGVRKATAFVSRHLARQVEVLVLALAAGLRRLDSRVSQLEAACGPAGSSSITLPADVLERLVRPLRETSPTPARIVEDQVAAATLPAASTGLVVLAGVTDPLTPGAKVALVQGALRSLAEISTLGIAGYLPGTWEEAVGLVAAELSPGRPFSPETWAAVLRELGFGDVSTRVEGGCHITWGRRPGGA